MTKIIQISDLHFGTETKTMLDLLLSDIHKANPDVIIISGDLTQRARRQQFKDAKEFIDKLNCENILCVPGNHDIALYRLIERFFYPFKRYQSYITDNMNPSYCDKQVAILGINSVTPYRAMSGTISEDQLNHIQQFFSDKSLNQTRIVVLHHNLIKSKRHHIISNSETFLNVLASCRVHLILSGHLHYACMEKLKRPYIFYDMYAITAGTAVSRRLRQGQNSYNIIQIEEDKFTMIVREFNKNKFVTLYEKEAYIVK